MSKEENQQPKAEEVKPPSMLTMIKSFARDYKIWAAAGHPATSAADYIERLTACKACPHLIEKHMRCGKCGCLVEHKAKWRTTTCPDDPQRWKPQDPNPQNAQEAKLKAQQIEDKQIEDELLEIKKKQNPDSDQHGFTREELLEYKRERQKKKSEENNKDYTDYEDV